MAIRFRCRQCQSLMSIATRRAGSIVPCATCGAEILVPLEDEWSPAEAVPAPPAKPFESPPAEQVEAAAVDEVEDAAAKPQEWSDPASDIEGPTASEAEDADDESFSLSRNKTVEEELDLTAMVDVVFQLLIFFMVTASFSLTKSIEMPAPDRNQQGAAQSMQPLDDLQDTSVIVEIDDRNAIVVDDEPLAAIEQLPDALRDRMRKQKKSELIVTAAAGATHRTVVAVIDAANEVGMQRIRMTAPGRNSSE